MVDGISSFSAGSALSSGGIGAPKEDIKQKLVSLGIPEEIVAQGKEAVKAYAEQNGISLPEPPKRPDESSIFGQAQGGEKEPPAELKQQLTSLGIPESVIYQGREAVMAYAQQNGITLPQPPTPPEAGNNLDITA